MLPVCRTLTLTPATPAAAVVVHGHGLRLVDMLVDGSSLVVGASVDVVVGAGVVVVVVAVVVLVDVVVDSVVVVAADDSLVDDALVGGSSGVTRL